jgi:hypothetical protein
MSKLSAKFGTPYCSFDRKSWMTRPMSASSGDQGADSQKKPLIRKLWSGSWGELPSW